MLGWLRTRTQNIFIYAIFAVIILAFTFSLGGGGGLSGAGNPNNIAVVYGQVIDRQTYSNALTDRERQFRRLMGDQWTDDKSREMGLPRQVLVELENQMLMRHAAEEMGLGITDTELRDAIISLPGFLTRGQFDYERYKRSLALQRRTPKQFEQSIRLALLHRKMYEFLLDSVHVSKAEVMEAFRKEREKVDLEFVAFDVEKYKKKISPDKNALAAFQEKEAERIQGYYDAHLSDYQRPKQAHAAHLLISVAKDASAADAKAAEARAARLAGEARKPGADFGKLAKENSGDTVTAQGGGELGWFGPGQMVKPFSDAVFGAKPGTIVGPVKTRFGYHVIKVMETRPPLDIKIDAVKGKIARQLLVEDEARAMAEADARSLIEKAASAPGLASLRRPAAARYGKTGPFTRGVAEIPALGRSAEAIKVAFSLTPEARVAPDPVAVGTSRVVLRLKDQVKAPDSPLTQDLDPFRQRLVEDKRRKTMVLWLETARAKAEREGELERNARALRDFLGPAPGSPS